MYIKSRVYEFLIINFHIPRHRILKVNRVCEFCPVNILTFSKWCATYILVCINDLPISMYTHYKTKCTLIIELVYVSLMSKPCK